jgi:hypothetical protein
MTVAWYACRATWRQMWRITLLVAVIGGLLGSVALGALAAARRTDSAYARYLHSVNASDVAVDIPGPVMAAVQRIEAAPMVNSGAAWLGMDADPVIHGQPDLAYQTNNLEGSLNGEFYRQDRVTVLAGKLPPPTSTGELMMTQSMAGAFARQHITLTVGDHISWQFYKETLGANGLPTGVVALAGPPVSFRIAAIVAMSPALTDEVDDVPTAILPPAATARFVPTRPVTYVEWGYGWAMLRLHGGDGGVPALRAWLNKYAAEASSKYQFPIAFVIRRLSIVQHEAQQGIEPEALALAVLGGLAVLALLVLMVQGLAQLLGRTAAGALTMRSLGAGRATAAAAAGGWAAVAVLGAVLLSVAGAVAISPLGPVGPVREYDPVRGVQADWLVLGAGGAALLVILLALLAWMAWQAVRQARELPASSASALAGAASRIGLPVTAVTGVRHALDRGTGSLRAPVRATIAGSVVAVTALVAALGFSASLTGLTTHPARYGWNWTVLIQSEGGWGTFGYGRYDPLPKLVAGQPGVTGWSEMGFGQLVIHGVEVPAMGLLAERGKQVVEPPTTSGHPLTAGNQIELGTVTMRQLGLHIGDRIRVGADPRPLTVVGAVTLPSIGVGLTDHPSLGRGAMMDETTLLTALGDPLHPTPVQAQETIASVGYPATAVFDVSSAADAEALGKHVTSEFNSLPGNAGESYTLLPQRGAPVRNSGQLGSQPRVLAAGVAAAALLALGLTILASVRQRRRDLAVLKALGMRSAQLRAVIGWQTTTILLIAVVVGVPLGIAAGNWAWTTFANSIGVVPLPVVPAAALVAGVAALLVTGNLLALWPAQVAARISPAATFRTE